MHGPGLLLAAPALPARGCRRVVFLERVPPTHTHSPSKGREGLQGGEEGAGSGVVSRLGHRWCRPYRVVNRDINQCYGAWDGVRYLWFEACWQGSALPES